MKERLDVLLVSKGFFESREKAKASIMAGIVFVDGQKIDKAGTMIDPDKEIEVRGNTCPYVSRGGYKLEKALNTWSIELNGKVCMDIGSSTGGFTDCMLQNGAEKVYAVDVGTNQLAYKLRVDPKVVVMEKTNIRNLDTSAIEKMDFICTDVSFISLKLVFPVVSSILKEGSNFVCLIKPQFEAGRENVGKGGLVKDKSVHVKVIDDVMKAAQNLNLRPVGLTFSPIKGEKSGNIEYLLILEKTSVQEELLPVDTSINNDIINSVVNDAHATLT